MSTSGLGSGNESPPSQTYPVMNLNSSSGQKHTQHEFGQLYLPLACDQLYENHSLNPPILRSRRRTQDLSTTYGNVPSVKSPGTLNHGSSCKYSSSSNLKIGTCTPDPYLGASPQLPPVLQLNKQAATITMPDGICCVINPYPERLGVTISKSEPSSLERLWQVGYPMVRWKNQ